MTPETLAELRRLAEAANADAVQGATYERDWPLSSRAVGQSLRAMNPDIALELVDAAAILADVREQVARGAPCPMCSTGMTRQTVGMVCQLCGTDYARPEYASLRRDSEQTTKAALADALAVRAERDALAAKVERVRDWLDHRGVDASDRDGDYMDGYRAAQRHAVIDAAELRAALDEEAQP